MNAVSAANVSILLVDGNPASAVMASLLLKSKYEVMTAATGRDALRILLTTQHGFNLVLVDINLPDMSSYIFVQEVVKKTELPVGMICDSYDQPIITKCRLSGAMLCLVKPLLSDDIEDLWQYPMLRQREVMLKSRRLPMSGSPENGPELHENGGGFQGQRKRKSEELGRGSGWSIGEPSSFHETVDVKRRFLNVTQGLSLSTENLISCCPLALTYFSLFLDTEAGPSVVNRDFNSPGITDNLVLRNLQQVRVYVTEQHALLSQTDYSDETSVLAPNPFSITDQPTGQETNNHSEIKYREEGESSLARYLENPHSREQLKRIIRACFRKWDIFLNLIAPSGTPPPPSGPVIIQASQEPLISVPIALAQEIEEFIHITEAARYAVPGCLDALASRVAAIGPPAAVELQLGDEEPEPGFMEDLDYDDIFDAIDELRD
ncbi:hypothetical protein RND81_03G203900 [Saponaria officinalis]|uniref:Response regulatory domain-containing protein n=1 Tax=Saponaria officinalis TaxID=3572 RepID=A0AAW1M9K5_SAPOF